MKGSLIQMTSRGAEDLHMLENPTLTFFKIVYKRHTSFSMESINQVFVDTPLFNNTNYITIRRKGDLISNIYLEVTLPSDPMLEDSYWTNRIGFNLIKKVELYIGKTLVDRQYGLWMHIWTELTHTIDRKNILNKIVGSTSMDGNSYGLPCNVSHTLTIPLMFSFCRHKNLALPLISLGDNVDVTLKFFFQTKANCIQSGIAPSGDMINPILWIDYIYLERQENLQFVQKPIEYLIEVTQHLGRNLISSGTKSILLPFNLSCKELMWVVQNKKPYGDKFTDFTYNGSSMINTVQFKFNSKNVFSSRAKSFDYFNYITPYQCHTGKPDLGINAYSFCLKPENLDPSGIINFSHVKLPTILLDTQGNGVFDIFALSYNVLRVEKGDIKLIYRY